MTITIRPERAGDEPAIHALTDAAFRDMPFSDGDEADLIDKLRADGDLVLSLVATNRDEAIVGHIAFSPVTISDGTSDWYGLGPVSVIPTNQHTGIGGQLIDRGIADMVARNAKGIVLLGNPKYYSRFGFIVEPRLTYAGGPAEYFQTLLLDGELPHGAVNFAPAFG
ncbi:GNAT family N-acetyltransferase [Parerythrobacter jejuensis]|uniref:GNAT family N-acetyltransferase n=1 Tax=Parerythrobacter jejuensis TaxID=795812 RepID=A0A845AWI0_9SPHN|nr:N-acetyltransferase [Parerythrobacter jejuensis]MXP31148.1 GNAT family N-acetyltransferase [Parerythrobacter jejuensis]MXP33908.1 GNAT family N-acetyltransferase [Parerythrobacter jejuensis]